MSIANWNNQPKIGNPRLISFQEDVQVAECARGLGRSYGDASLNEVMRDMTGHKAVFELQDGILELSSGFSVGEILNRIVPHGYTLPVIPGTRHVTVGGMIAADVHGKNHALNGSIGSWVERIHLRLADGSELSCSPHEYADVFRATLGGLGLTGLILNVRLKLERISGVRWTQGSISFSSMEELIDGLVNSTASHKAAWFDARSGSRFFLLENTVLNEEQTLMKFRLNPPKFQVPSLPFSLVSSALMRIYNWNYARKLKGAKTRTINWDECFFPLDSIAHWNRLYGPRGFYQLQCVFPLAKAKNAYRELLDRMRSAGRYPVLSVMKLHGARPVSGLLSFAHPGISVAFDFINTRGTAEFIRELHDFIAQEGGRIYLVKDALLSPETFEKMYPEAEEFRNLVARYNSGHYTSLLAKRLNLVRQ